MVPIITMMDMQLLWLAVLLVCSAWAQNEPQLIALHQTLQSLCRTSITFPGRRQLLFPINDNYKLYELTSPIYTGPDRSGG